MSEALPERPDPPDVRPESDPSEDLQLARQALAGNEQARASFARRMECVPKILFVLNGQRGHPLTRADLEDLSQQVLTTIWRRLDTYLGQAALETWAYRFCYLSMANDLRNRRRRARPGPRPLVDTGEPERAQSAPEEVFRFEYLHRALERIQPREATVIRLYHFEALSFEQIAERTETTPSAAKATYYRAIARLREILDPLRKESGL